VCLPNAEVLLQASNHHCGVAASDGRSSAATIPPRALEDLEKYVDVAAYTDYGIVR